MFRKVLTNFHQMVLIWNQLGQATDNFIFALMALSAVVVVKKT